MEPFRKEHWPSCRQGPPLHRGRVELEGWEQRDNCLPGFGLSSGPERISWDLGSETPFMLMQVRGWGTGWKRTPGDAALALAGPVP